MANRELHNIPFCPAIISDCILYLVSISACRELKIEFGQLTQDATTESNIDQIQMGTLPRFPTYMKLGLGGLTISIIIR